MCNITITTALELKKCPVGLLKIIKKKKRKENKPNYIILVKGNIKVPGHEKSLEKCEVY